MRRSAIERPDCAFDPRYHIIGDFDFVVRTSINWKLSYLQTPVAYYRWHGNNESIHHRSREIGELETWYAEMMNNDRIAKEPGFVNILDKIHYLKGMLFVSERDLKQAFSAWQSMRWGWFKAKLLAALVLPLALVRLLRQ